MLSDRVPAALETLLRGVRAPGECVIFHRGVDCQVAGGPDCIEETRGARLLGGVERAPRPYYDHVLRAEPVRLERWERPNEEGGEATASPR